MYKPVYGMTMMPGERGESEGYRPLRSIISFTRHKNALVKKQKALPIFREGLRDYYFAYETDLVSRITVTLI